MRFELGRILMNFACILIFKVPSNHATRPETGSTSELPDSARELGELDPDLDHFTRHRFDSTWRVLVDR